MAVNLLLSYAMHAKTDLAAIRRDLVCGLMMIDSGAFSVHTSGREITLDAYAEYLEQWAGCWDHAVTLDVIGDPVATAANTRKLHARGLPVMPVFTLGGTLADFDAMVRDVGYVCVGGLVSGMPAAARAARARMLQRRAQDAGGGIHALGAGSMRTLRAAQPYSSDASTVSSAFRFGTVVYFDGTNVRNTVISDRVRLTLDREHITAHGVNLAEIVRSGRLPTFAEGGRQILLRAMSLSYSAADEVLKCKPVPMPQGPPWCTPGPHLYGAAPYSDAPHMAKADAAVHAGWRPPVWAKYGATHVCRRVGAGRVSAPLDRVGS